MELLLVGQADSIFFEYYTKKLKGKNPDINIDVFSIDAITGKYDLTACRAIFPNKWEDSILSKIKGIRFFIKPFYTWYALHKFLRAQQKQYDIIHFKWLIPGVILFPNHILKYSKKTVATFWGGELEHQRILLSKALYRSRLKSFLKKADCITYITNELFDEIKKLGIDERRLTYAIYSSGVYAEIDKIKSTEDRRTSKKRLGINPNTITLSIGYSGKKIHQHTLILDALFTNPDFRKNKEKFTIILPMMYGCATSYTQQVENLAKSWDANYLLLTEHLDEPAVARLRNATDILIQLSLFDAHSASIIETILAGTILIAGQWLPYDIFKEKQLRFYEQDHIDASLPELVMKISDNMETELTRCEDNRVKWGVETWDETITNWMAIYDRIEQEEFCTSHLQIVNA